MAATADPEFDFLRAALVPLDAAHVSGSLDAAEGIRAKYPGIAARSIHVAAALGDDAAVGEHLSGNPGAATLTGGPYGWDPLTCLCFSRYLRIDESRSESFVRAAGALLDAGADPNTGFLSDEEPRPVWESVIYGAAGVAHHAPMTRLLLERGADPNDEETAYHAAEWFDVDCVQALVESGQLGDVGLTTLLHRKLDWTHFKGVVWLLEHGADPNAMSLWCRRALHHALERDNPLKYFEVLLHHGADPTLTDLDGRTAVQWAAGFGRGDVLELFDARGFDTTLEGEAGFFAACARGDAAAAHESIAREPDIVERMEAAHPSALAYFAGSGNTAGVRILLDAGFSLQSATELAQSRGEFPLHVAVWRGRVDTVRLLIERGASVEQPSRNGETPIQLAARALVEQSEWTPHESPEILNLLRAAGVNREGDAG